MVMAIREQVDEACYPITFGFGSNDNFLTYTVESINNSAKIAVISYIFSPGDLEMESIQSDDIK